MEVSFPIEITGTCSTISIVMLLCYVNWVYYRGGERTMNYEWVKVQQVSSNRLYDPKCLQILSYENLKIPIER